MTVLIRCPGLKPRLSLLFFVCMQHLLTAPASYFSHANSAEDLFTCLWPLGLVWSSQSYWHSEEQSNKETWIPKLESVDSRRRWEANWSPAKSHLLPSAVTVASVHLLGLMINVLSTSWHPSPLSWRALELCRGGGWVDKPRRWGSLRAHSSSTVRALFSSFFIPLYQSVWFCFNWIPLSPPVLFSHYMYFTRGLRAFLSSFISLQQSFWQVSVDRNHALVHGLPDCSVTTLVYTCFILSINLFIDCI